VNIEVWAAFAVLELVLCLTPGPAVLFVISTALLRGPRAGLAGAAGIVAANTVYFALSALGVAAIVLASHDVFLVLKWLGGAYLIWLGVRMLVGRASPAAAGHTAAPTRRAAGTFAARGFAVQMANPKALAFFVALLPQFIDPHLSVAHQAVILGITSAVIEYGVQSFYVWLASRAGSFVASRWPRLMKRAAGGFLIAAGARLALAREP
jgi:homoserine/homoserine lactone efflux protein